MCAVKELQSLLDFLRRPVHNVSFCYYGSAYRKAVVGHSLCPSGGSNHPRVSKRQAMDESRSKHPGVAGPTSDHLGTAASTVDETTPAELNFVFPRVWVERYP